MAHIDHGAGYDDAYLRDILASVRTVAVVGASPEPSRPSHEVMLALRQAGYAVIPINPRPGLAEIAGLRVYPSLAALEGPVDMVDVFRRSEALPEVAREAVAAGAGVLWSQLDVYDEAAARLAEAAGLRVVMDRCPKIELARLGMASF